MNKNLEIKRDSTYWAEVCIAGDYDVAKQKLRKYTFDVGLCVTLTKTDFVYTGGLEEGIIVRIVNYPRFPKNEYEIDNIANDLAEFLMNELYQLTALVVTSNETYWFNKRYE